ncbi:MAG: sulfotransferase family protein [Actinomycetota bacterium]|nr:hypothetical protein [Rubrobacteraceae bacterium]MDQ3183773.1 sulfotransferase family protein [Actinomycetota bacterium]
MLLAPGKGFVFLAMPKSGSTSIETAFLTHSQMILQKPPAIKHTTYAGFQRFLQPFLNSKGFPRESYEVVCVFREPIDWLSSWWRYRSREKLANPRDPKHRNYTGDVSFEQFARAYMEGSEQFAQVGRMSRFVQPSPGGAEVDRIFRYDRLDLLVDFLCEKVGEEVEVGSVNTSPERSVSLSEECEIELREFFAPEYRIYEQAIGG